MIGTKGCYFSADAGGGSAGGTATLIGGSKAEAAPVASAATAGTAVAGASGGELRSSQHASANAPASWFKDDAGTFAEGWFDRLPGDLKGQASLKAMPSLEALAKSYVETKRMVGARMEAPGEQATPEQIAAWRRVVGAPEKPEGYLGEGTSLRPERIPENMWDGEREQQFLALAHKHHLPPGAVKEIMGFYGEHVAQNFERSQQEETAMLGHESTRLRQAWGTEFDSNLQLAARVAQTVGLDPKSHPIFTSAEVVQAFARMGRLLSEDRLVTGQVRGMAGSTQDRIQDITDPRSQSSLAREYRGEYGPERQRGAQEQLHQLYASMNH